MWHYSYQASTDPAPKTLKASSRVLGFRVERIQKFSGGLGFRVDRIQKFSGLGFTGFRF